MTDQPTTADLLFPLLVEASNEADLDINDQDIRDGHHRIEPFVSLARKAFELGAKLAAEELGAYPLRYVRLVSDELDRLKAEVEQLKAELAKLRAHGGFGTDGGPVEMEMRYESQIWPADPDGECSWRYWESGQLDRALKLAAEDAGRDDIARTEVVRFRAVTYHADREVLGRFGGWPEAAQPVTGVEHPADGTLSPELSSEQDGAAA